LILMRALASLAAISGFPLKAL
jgi:hypothetical protein